MTTVLLVRHGRTNANSTGILAGRSPGVELDEVGQAQAVAAAARIAKVPLRAVVTSPLRRCRQTAQALTADREAPTPVVEQGLIECGYGQWTGRSLKDLSKEKLWQTVQQQPSAVRFPDGESMVEMSARAVTAIRGWDRRLAEQYDDNAVWVAVSHGDVIKAILADALGMHLDAFQRILVDPASISVIRYLGSRTFVLTMNSSAGELNGLAGPSTPAKGGRRKSASADAPVGGGLGSGEGAK